MSRLPPLYSGNEKYGFIVGSEDFTSKKLTTKLIQQIQVGSRLNTNISVFSDASLPVFTDIIYCYNLGGNFVYSSYFYKEQYICG